MTELEKAIANEDILTAAADLRAMAASKNMSELAYFARSNLGQAFIAAASSWAALVWRKGTERPERDGWRVCVLPNRDGRATGMLCFVDSAWGMPVLDGFFPTVAPLYWLDGSLPPLPEATDEG